MRGPSRFAAAALAAFLLAGCREVDSKFPETGSLFGSIVIAQVNADTSRTPVPREFRFRIRAYDAELYDTSGALVTAWSFLEAERTPCTYVFSIANILDPLAATQLTRQCGGGGIVLDAGTTGSFAFILDLESISAVHAERPNLSAGRDYDGDGVPNETDNCPTQFNPRVPRDPLDPGAGTWQPDSNGDGSGDACSVEVVGSDGTVFLLPDQDLDGVTDGADNCAWYPNPSQTDANDNSIGDACERTVPVVMNAGSRFVCPSLDLGPEPYEIPVSELVFYSVDFTDAVRCDPAYTGCELDPSALTLLGRSGVPDGAETELSCGLLP
jgi:hypothetical protein